MNSTLTEIKKGFPCDLELRENLRLLRTTGKTSNSKLARACGLNDAVVSQYLNDDGCLYPGDIAKVERKFSAWLERRSVDNLAGIPTIQTPVSEQIASAAKMVRRCRIMGKGIGRAGIGKTRGAILLRSNDETTLLNFISRETGSLEAVRSRLFKQLGVQGPRKRTGNRRRLMYAELVKRLCDSDLLLAIDQAHRLSLPAMEFLAELWNDTHAPQLWLGTSALADKLERDEQVASRVAFTFELSVLVDKTTNEVRALVEHQIKSRLGDVNGEMAGLLTQCEQLAFTGCFRRVEMRLATMLYLSENPCNKGKSWGK
ncbi:MAG TPA: hypothetical protein DCQ92_11250, partial [Verrucomicrobia subdivision 3 bacterium]|nr:hypothetical protein [Limisphaerales bacterium]